MGIGMVIIVDGGKADTLLRFIRRRGQPAWVIGEIRRGSGLSRVV
jgi:phosphoribosylaminoimidazole (AIR) synthetase